MSSCHWQWYRLEQPTTTAETLGTGGGTVYTTMVCMCGMPNHLSQNLGRTHGNKGMLHTLAWGKVSHCLPGHPNREVGEEHTQCGWGGYKVGGWAGTQRKNGNQRVPNQKNPVTSNNKPTELKGTAVNGRGWGWGWGKGKRAPVECPNRNRGWGIGGEER